MAELQAQINSSSFIHQQQQLDQLRNEIIKNKNNKNESESITKNINDNNNNNNKAVTTNNAVANTTSSTSNDNNNEMNGNGQHHQHYRPSMTIVDDFDNDHHHNDNMTNNNITNIIYEQQINAASSSRFCIFFYLFIFMFYVIFLEWTNSKITRREIEATEIVDIRINEHFLEFLYDIQILSAFTTIAFGLYSLFRKNYRCFLLFIIFNFVTFILTSLALYFSIKSYFQMDIKINKRGEIIDLFSEHMKKYDWHDATNESTKFINNIQFGYHCCGGHDGYKEWEPLKPSDINYGAFPISCCELDSQPNDGINLNWCPYDKVEKMPDCPSVFVDSLIRMRKIRYTMNVLLFQALFLQIVAISSFSYLMYLQFF